MLNKQLLAPESIVVVGASNNITKPGGKILRNLIEHEYKGRLIALNPNDVRVQDVETFNHLGDLPDIDLAILAIPAKAYCLTINFFMILWSSQHITHV